MFVALLFGASLFAQAPSTRDMTELNWMEFREWAYRDDGSARGDQQAKQGFRNIIVVNGHGGPQTAILKGDVRLTTCAKRRFGPLSLAP